MINFNMSRSKSINEQYDKLEKIGEGSYGTVYKAKDKMTGGIVALKRIPLDVEPEGVPSTTIREIGLLRELNHPNLIELLGVSKCDDNLYLVFEYLDQDLRQLLDDETISMSESVVKSYLWQMLQAIAHCHTKRILHRDLKPQNLLIDFQGNIKLADLGLARSIDLPIQPYTHEVVTLWYRAPEILLGSTVYGPPVDIWAIGCIFAEMCTRKVLFLGDSEIDQIFRIFRTLGTPTDEIWPGVTDLPDFQRTFPSWNLRDLDEILPELKKDPLDLLKLMLIYDPFKRVAARKALTHKYFKDVTIKPLKKKSSTTKS